MATLVAYQFQLPQIPPPRCAVLPAISEFVRMTLSSLARPPPPCDAELPLTVVLLMLQMSPQNAPPPKPSSPFVPSPPVAELPVIESACRTSPSSSSYSPPPLPLTAVLPEKVDPLMVSEEPS